jgi:hypothetical protein
MSLRLLLLSACLPTVGCFAVTNLDRFEQSGDGDVDSVRDLRMTLRGLEDAVGKRVEIRLVNRETLFVMARAVLETLSETEAKDGAVVFLPKGVPPGEFIVQVFIDGNDNGVYDRPEGEETVDPAYSLALPATGILEFNTKLENGDELPEVDIGDPPVQHVGRDLLIHFVDMVPHSNKGQRLELRVLNIEAEQVVGYYRIPKVRVPDFDVALAGLIIPGKQYQIDFYADVSNPGQYDAPPLDHAWREVHAGASDGLEFDFVHNTRFFDIMF